MIEVIKLIFRTLRVSGRVVICADICYTHQTGVENTDISNQHRHTGILTF